jgi:hypothetical protein
MKNIIILLLCLLFVSACHAITDSLISEWAVDGIVAVWDYDEHKSANTVSLEINPGDGPDLINGGENYCRGYLSFNLDSLPESTNVQSALLKVYQAYSIGNDTLGVFPRWTGIPGGDTMYCLLDHVDYGATLDTLDWTAGDVGDPQTITSKFGIISSTPDTCWKTLDVTSCVRADLLAKRNRSQYRMRFAVNTDFDMRGDAVSFHSGNSSVVLKRPRVIIDYVVGVAEQPEMPLLPSKTTLSKCSPTPFSNNAYISYSLSKPETVELNVYNLNGKLIRRLVNKQQNSGHYQVCWDGRDNLGKNLPNGVYFYQLKTNGNRITKKTIIIR